MGGPGKVMESQEPHMGVMFSMVKSQSAPSQLTNKGFKEKVHFVVKPFNAFIHIQNQSSKLV